MHPVQVKKWTTVQQLRLGYKPLCNPAFLVSSRVFGPEALRRCFSTVLPGRKFRVRRLATSMARHLARPAKCVRTPLFAKTLNSDACARRPGDRACLLCAGEMAYSQRQTGVSVRCICALYLCGLSVCICQPSGRQKIARAEVSTRCCSVAGALAAGRPVSVPGRGPCRSRTAMHWAWPRGSPGGPGAPNG